MHLVEKTSLDQTENDFGLAAELRNSALLFGPLRQAEILTASRFVRVLRHVVVTPLVHGDGPKEANE